MRAEPKAIWRNKERTKLLLSAMTVHASEPYSREIVLWRNHVWLKLA